MKKTSIIGSGNVGATAALLIAAQGLADVTLLDIVEGTPQGKALDMSQAMALFDSNAKIRGTNDYGDLADSDVVVVTAGLPRRPGMPRSDLLSKNAAIVGSVVERVVKHAPQAILLMVTNPLDAMTYLAYKKSGWPKHRVMGMGGLLDTSRMRYYLAEAGGTAITGVEAMVVGAHGDDMVPVSSLAELDERRAGELLGKDVLSGIAEKTRHGGAEIVGLLKTGSAFYAPGASVATMVKAILKDEKETISTCCLAEGEYGQNGLFLNLPAIIGAGGVEKIVELDLSPDESAALKRSAESVRASIEELGFDLRTLEC